jgi:hypothetical protein
MPDTGDFVVNGYDEISSEDRVAELKNVVLCRVEERSFASVSFTD